MRSLTRRGKSEKCAGRTAQSYHNRAEVQWNFINHEQQFFWYRELPPPFAFAVPRWRRGTCDLLSIFLSFLTPGLVAKVLAAVDAQVWFRDAAKTKRITVDERIVYLCYAMAIRIQGKQDLNIPLRAAVNEAREHFSNLYPDVTPPNEKTMQKVLAHVHITNEFYKELSNNFAYGIVHLGQHVAGDEKLFKFFGVSQNIRVVKSKPDHIGLWIYELACKLTDGSSYMVNMRLQDVNPKLKESIPTAEVMEEWMKLIKDKNADIYSETGSTILVCDMYYLDQSGLQLFRDSNPPVDFICAIQRDRFQVLCEMSDQVLEKPGDFCLIENSQYKELFVANWHKNPTLGVQHTLSNAFRPTHVNKHDQLIPVYDEYGAMMKTCDVFNKYLDTTTWPYRHGGGETFGESGVLHDFAFTCILLNTININNNVNQISKVDATFQISCEQLSDQLYAKFVEH